MLESLLDKTRDLYGKEKREGDRFFPGLYREDIKALPRETGYDLLNQSKAAMYELKIVRKRRQGYGAFNHLGNSKDVYEAFHKRYEQADREEFLALLLDTKNYVVGFNVISVGSLNCSIVHPREVFKAAILANAASIILTHNHPSGDPNPSTEDVAITKKIKEAGEIIGIRVIDHVVMGDNCHFSFAEKGML